MSTSILDVRRCAMIAGLLWGITATPVSAATLYVAPDGNDAWSGKLQHSNAQRTDGPLATLAGARNAFRRAKTRGPLTEAVCVQVAAGTYPLLRRRLLLKTATSVPLSPPLGCRCLPLVVRRAVE